MSVTQKDIAQRLKISRSLVAEALSNNSRISEQTKALVQQTAREMNYRPNMAARSIKVRKTYLVGVLVRDIPHNLTTHPLAWEFILGITEGLLAQGYTPCLVRLTDVQTDGGLGAPVFKGHLLDGMIVVSAFPMELEAQVEALVPHCIWLDCDVWRPQQCIRRDETFAGHTVAESLIALGYRRLIHVAGSLKPDSHYSAVQRTQAIQEAAGAAGVDLEYLVLDQDDVEPLLLKMLPQVTPDTAVILREAYTIVPMLNALEEAGMQMGVDFGLACCDDTFHGFGFNSPRISRVGFDRFDMGKQAAEMMRQLLDDPANPPDSRILRDCWQPGASVRRQN